MFPLKTFIFSDVKDKRMGVMDLADSLLPFVLLIGQMSNLLLTDLTKIVDIYEI